MNRTRIVQEEDKLINGFNDINYNFLISRFGIIEGRGWDVKPQSRLNLSNLGTIVVGFFADFLYVPGAMLNETLELLISDGKYLEKLKQNANWTCQLDLCFETSRAQFNFEQ